MALAAKYSRFVEEYLVDLNATEAYGWAGYALKSAVINYHVIEVHNG